MADNDIDKEYFEEIVRIYKMLSGEPAEALDMAGQLLKSNPDKAPTYFVVAMYAFTKNDYGRAIELLNNAHERDHDCREYADCLAALYNVTGKLADGLYFAKLATALDSRPEIAALVPPQLANFFEAIDRIPATQHYAQALAAFHSRHYSKSVEFGDMEIRVNQDHDLCLRVMGQSQLKLASYNQAAAALQGAIHLQPDLAENYQHLGDALYHLGKFDDAVACHRHALAMDTKSTQLATTAISGAESLGIEGTAIRKSFEKEMKKRTRAHRQSDAKQPRNKAGDDRIRVGIVSNQLFDCEASLFINALFENIDHGKFEIFVYQHSIGEDSVTVSLKNCTDSWRQIYDLGDEVMDIIINGDENDVMMDFCGYTPDNRAGLIAMKSAAVGIGWLEYPYGINAPGIDYVLSDTVTLASDEKSLSEDQAALQLPSGLFSIAPLTVMSAVGDLPASTEGRVTFGGSCDLSRLPPATAEVWSRVLMAVPRSRLLLRDVPAISSAVKERAVEMFSHFGVANRIMFWVDEDGHRLQTDFYHNIDLLLDTVPISGRIDICEAIWMGVPVLSINGKRRAGQIGASLLHSAGKPEWICASPKKMVSLAKSLTKDLDKLADTRKDLREQALASNLFNPGKFAKEMGSAIETAFKAGATS